MIRHPVGQYPEPYVHGLHIGPAQARKIKADRLRARVWLAVLIGCTAFWSAVAAWAWGFLT